MHIPKTAGTSLRVYLESHYQPHEICPSQLWGDLVATQDDQLRKYKLFSGHFFFFHDRLPCTPALITVFRDPLQRAVSEFAHLCVDPGHRLHPLVKKRNLDLLGFLRTDSGRRHLQNYQARHLVSNIFPEAREKRPDRPPGALDDMPVSELEDQAMIALDKIEMMGTTDRLEVFVDLLAYHFDWYPVDDVPILNRTAAGNPPPNDDAVELLADMTGVDTLIYQRARQSMDTHARRMMQDLLGERFGQRRWRQLRDRVLRQDGALVVDSDVPLWGTGWYRPERDPDTGVSYRWSGPETTSLLALPLEKRNYRISIEVPHTATPGILHDVALSINDTPVELEVSVDDRQRRSLVGHVPSGAISGDRAIGRLELSTPRTASPVELGKGPDSRRLGIAVSRITLLPDADEGPSV